MTIKCDTACHINEEVLPLTTCKSHLELLIRTTVQVNLTYSNDTASAEVTGVIASTKKEYQRKDKAFHLSVLDN